MSSIIVHDQQSALDSVKSVKNIILALRNQVFTDGLDYGTIPGTGDRPTLLLPGMEKLLRALNLRPEYKPVSIREDFDKPLFMYRYQCELYDIGSGACVATAIGSANSMEAKWAWRWVELHQVTSDLTPDELTTRTSTRSEFDFAIEKAETTGKYGKPAAYWQEFKDAIKNGSAKRVKKQTRSGKQLDAWEIGGTLYRIPNPDIFDQINTIDKIAQKRALGSAVKLTANVSELFTVDLEDFTPFNIAKPRPAYDARTGEVTAPDLPPQTVDADYSELDSNDERYGADVPETPETPTDGMTNDELTQFFQSAKERFGMDQDAIVAALSVKVPDMLTVNDFFKAGYEKGHAIGYMVAWLKGYDSSEVLAYYASDDGKPLVATRSVALEACEKIGATEDVPF